MNNSRQEEFDGVLVFDQHAANKPSQIETPLHHAELNRLSIKKQSQDGDVVFCEHNLTGLLTLRVKADSNRVNEALSQLLGAALPGRLSFCVGGAAMGDNNALQNYCIRWMAPDEWLLSCPVEKLYWLENALRAKLSGASFALINVTGGYSIITLGGLALPLLLKKSTHYDVHPVNFPVGKSVNTTFAKAQAVLSRTSESQVELIVRRSFADYLWLWITDASREYGLRILADAPTGQS